jgi:hypothetical protein
MCGQTIDDMCGHDGSLDRRMPGFMAALSFVPGFMAALTPHDSHHVTRHATHTPHHTHLITHTSSHTPHHTHLITHTSSHTRQSDAHTKTIRANAQRAWRGEAGATSRWKIQGVVTCASTRSRARIWPKRWGLQSSRILGLSAPTLKKRCTMMTSAIST